MAEIKIEKKKPIWPWIVLLLIIAIAAILYFMNQDEINDEIDDSDDIENIDDVDDMDDMDDMDDADDTADFNSEREDESQTYGEGYSRQESDRVMTDYRSSLADSTKIGADANYTRNTLAQLVSAVKIKANQYNVNASQTIDSLEMGLTAATNTTANTMALNATALKQKTERLVDVLEDIQQKQFPNLSNAVMELKMASNDINANTTLAQQRTNLNKFFNQAANLLNNMN